MSVGWSRLPESVAREWRNPAPVMMWPEPFVFSVASADDERTLEDIPPQVAIRLFASYMAPPDATTDASPFEMAWFPVDRQSRAPILVLRERPRSDMNAESDRRAFMRGAADQVDANQRRRPWWRRWRRDVGTE